MNRWYTIKAADVRGTAEISIYEEIGGFGITAKQFTEDLKALGDVSHINLRIHSPGGDVFEGIAIYNLLRNHPADITVYIDGVAASMASVVAMAGDRVVMPENAMMMIHKPWGISGGNAGDMRDYADLLDKVETVLIPAYARKTGKSAQEIATMLEDETWMDGKECLKHGFADELLPSVRAMARIESKRTGDFLHMPETIKGMITPPKSQAKNTITGDQERINGIKEIFSVFGNQYDGIKMSCLEDASCTLEMARERLLNEMGKNHTPTNKNIPSHIYAGNGNITGDAIRQGLYSRLGYERPERGNPYAMMSLFEMAQASLTDRGITVNGFINRSQVVNAAFTHSSSDFSHILAGGAEKSVLKGWQDSGETFQKWTRTGSLSNFHEAKRVGLNGFSKLDKVPEGAEYKYITTSDKGVPIALATYGNIFSVTRQAIINDDLTQLTTIPMAMGRAAARTVGNLVYLLLTGNGKFTDGKALFHADHKNLIAKDMDMEGLNEARKLMRLQEDANGDSLNITPAFVLVPAALESAAHRAILSSSSLFPVDGEGTINQNPGIINVVKDMAEVIVEPRLDKANSKEWYVAAAKGMDTIEVAYLDGIDTPYLEEQEGFTVDGVAWKVRIDAGVAALDYRGLLKSSGA
ncbi:MULTISPECIES: ClpP-like prohead protease/major capsid protein fusion protein [Enterobacteriaceae]|uniref:ClpP-like prohead protease/major capsid protein fusion protein n=1 Tax=Enterobacteriaceae TaxID=543 RepID=UPI000663D560|nr:MULTISPECIES: ClpP-like prohead protease/major capsid protein fusion protein [Enterobacteriaceae]EFK6635257.1 Clp protease ClpP [Escherichia coli]MDS1461435.1 Clp protease ClpP [Escherichia coli]MDS1461449.1 Clp protease ClpP [Escherichia coli]MDS1461463.1 Clp protease ClpP [Escherichia coli]CAD7363904.1 phage portal protein, lambda family [Escherichia coli]